MQIKIEDLKKADIDGMETEDLKTLRNRFLQMNDKWWGSESWPDCTKAVCLEKYRYVMDAFAKRELIFIPREIDQALFGVLAKEISEGVSVDHDGEFEAAKEVEKTENGQQQKPFSKLCRFVAVTKAEENPEHYVMSVVYEPDVRDTQDDWATADEIRKAAWSFMESDQIYKLNHDEEAEVHVLESYLAPVDFEAEEQKITAGTWLLGSRIMKDETWDKIESGEYTGYSLAGDALRFV